MFMPECTREEAKTKSAHNVTSFKLDNRERSNGALHLPRSAGQVKL